MAFLSLLLTIEKSLLLAPLLLDGSRYPQLGLVIQQVSNGFATNAMQFLTALVAAAMHRARLAHVAALLLGVRLQYRSARSKRQVG